jgi:hypothetical protein
MPTIQPRRVIALFAHLSLFVLLLAAWPANVAARQSGASSPAARPADVASMDAILHAVYDVISGPVGQARDWDRFRSLFLPEARLVSTGRDAAGVPRYRVLTPSEYATTSGPSLERIGFMEKEIARRTETFGNIAHAFSTYESAFTGQNGQPGSARGINSIQLFNDGSRWWVLSIFWDSERPDNPIPQKYLSGGT